ncbi:hypothetical protein EYZ11_009998 [Aspergillus tanneri]|uniref:Probable guanine deaminase n=1 Tax=Aspergillus tanneri TaxID=1220188 RepID=A0A4S3J6Q5_9EURO|nr:uncharacterized protein ATNIH1004_003592 [Aspergillus tanneri]KAA8650903.1 hypothetical protein ATNIH1004_003592 [Aspergillus tanneri]THC90535.1 hypothetical protein EYZ11_009998 [Aspergillus tanneri]
MAHSFHGTLIHSISPSTLEILANTLIVVSSSGTILSIHPSTDPDDIPSLLSPHHLTPSTCPTLFLSSSQFLCPGFIDTHTHAPQWSQRGLGRGLPLLAWLETLTFANEAKCASPDHATKLYTSCVRGGLNQGITTACYYGSLHKSASLILARICLQLGQRALIGKCNMNRHAPSWYTESSTDQSLVDTESFIHELQALDPIHNLITPVLTPRFAISCSPDLLSGLGDLARKHPHLPIQTHFNESRAEIDFTASLFPTFTSETEIYESFHLLTNKSILAHAIFLKHGELDRLRQLDCGIAHCPVSNTCMDEYMIAPVREYLDAGIKVGLGTDCGGGYTSSMLEVMRQAYLVSVARKTISQGKGEALSVDEGFYMATLGGARVAGLDAKVGNFVPGKELDALLVSVDVDGVMADVAEGESRRDVFEKFVMTGDDRNIVGVWVRGKRVK